MDKKRFFLFLSFMFILTIVNAGTINKDSLKSKYDINDPRNPNCPCHKYQKIADEEYKLGIINVQKSEKVSNSTQHSITKSTQISSRNRFIKRWSRHNQWGNIQSFKRRKHNRKRMQIKWKSMDSCFSWK